MKINKGFLSNIQTINKTGYRVSLSDNGDVIGISDPKSNNNSGEMAIYNLNSSGTWNLVSDVVGNKSGNYLGWSLSVSGNGNYIAIGSSDSTNSINILKAGHVDNYEINLNNYTTKSNGILDLPLTINAGEKYTINHEITINDTLTGNTRCNTYCFSNW